MYASFGLSYVTVGNLPVSPQLHAFVTGIRELAMGASESIKEDVDVLSYYR